MSIVTEMGECRLTFSPPTPFASSPRPLVGPALAVRAQGVPEASAGDAQRREFRLNR
jgi:hypothetical protein